ncbi:peroxynitrite isomerase THAP4-like [Aethina tumida]|uniref:peroxynitrite isomerase THAP4-like n=1 Tax=Aethina tumida TaxID=116153 RepID=UPI00096B647D|nr:peroxynitrite isomerase THAP4-like [Aethina tumida]
MFKTSVHEATKPLSWLLGKWKSVSANGSYPTINPFSYCEELTFTTIGQPMLNYNSVTWHPTEKRPMHLESGYLRIKPGTNEVAFMVAHNFGLTSLEEGTVDNKKLNTSSTQIGRMSFAKDPAVIGIQRTYTLNDEGKLELVLAMETENIGLKEHLRVLYEKIE